ncbi:hypothetical protein AK973_4311 [Pseudomonas brassicacearum]|nr:hypothetical protein AK973_4311 [Pseudomonas brassicacearum]
MWEQSLLAMTLSPTTPVLALKMLSRASLLPQVRPTYRRCHE